MNEPDPPRDPRRRIIRSPEREYQEERAASAVPAAPAADPPPRQPAVQAEAPRSTPNPRETDVREGGRSRHRRRRGRGGGDGSRGPGDGSRGRRDGPRGDRERDHRAEPLGERDRGRGERDRGPGRERRDERTHQAAAEAIAKPRRLDLTRPADEPLEPDEVQEMSAHLRFIRRFKSHLKLALNAAEDLLINGVKPPSDRGTCRHLLAKIDRPTIQRVLSRDPVKSNMPERAAFLAGIVRIDPDLGLLLEYLDALSSSPDKRDAARAFSVTVDRIDFTSISQAQLAKVLSVISHTFGGHDRVQVLFGLLDSESFRAALDRSLGAVDPALAGAFGPLSAVHRAVVQGVALAAEEDADEKQSQLLHAGVVELLAAPDHVLRAYPEPVRARLAELAMAGRIDEGTARQATRRLLETLPTKDDKYLPLRLARAEQLLRTGDDDDARALIAKIAKTNPALEWAVRRNEALSWRQVGRVTVSGPDKDDGTLRRGFWLDESCFAWVRTAPPDQAGRAVAEAVLQADLQMAGVVPVLAHGLGKDGTVWVAIPAIGDPITSAAFSQLAIRDALIVAYDGVSLLGGLARAGIELPDLQRSRFLALRTASQLADLDPSSAPRLLLASLSGAVARDSGFAAIAHTKLAAKWCREVIFGANRASLSRDIRTKLGGQAPIPIMLRAITTALARL